MDWDPADCVGGAIKKGKGKDAGEWTMKYSSGTIQGGKAPHQALNAARHALEDGDYTHVSMGGSKSKGQKNWDFS
jgi:hypothetical protein